MLLFVGFEDGMINGFGQAIPTAIPEVGSPDIEAQSPAPPASSPPLFIAL